MLDMDRVMHTFSVAPMMDWTDRYCRAFHRMLSRHALLYAEMVVADAVIHGERARLIGFDSREHPVAAQLGGSDPARLAEAARILEDFGYDEINLNVGCPSDRVQSGWFGACMMAKPELVAECFSAMQGAVSVPVTIKCRIGIDAQDPYEALPVFVETVKRAGCPTFIIHARKAWLEGLSPKDNRTIPPLDYELVRQVKRDHPDLTVILNGGLETLEQAKTEAQGLDGVMLGRAAYHTPWILTGVDEMFYGGKPFLQTREQIIENLIDYARSLEQNDPGIRALPRHIMGLMHGQKGARLWRQKLSEPARGRPVSTRIKAAWQALQAARERAA